MRVSASVVKWRRDEAAASRVRDARNHLASALAQTLETDDEINTKHMREALRLLDEVLKP